MKKQILSEEFQRMQKLAGILTEEVDIKEFDTLVNALEKAKIPCEVKLTEFEGKQELEVLLGYNYPDALVDKVDDAVDAAGLDSNKITISAESYGSKKLQSKRLNGGPKRYK